MGARSRVEPVLVTRGVNGMTARIARTVTCAGLLGSTRVTGVALGHAANQATIVCMSANRPELGLVVDVALARLEALARTMIPRVRT